MNNLHLIVRDQFPDFVREDYPTFVSFVEAYYRWLEQQSVGDLDQVLDIDDPARTFVEYFGRQLDGLYLLESKWDPLFLSKIREIYTAKGSEYALINVLRTINQVDAEINYPADQILKASDGRWNQTKSFAVQSVRGIIPVNPPNIYVKYPFEEREIVISRIDRISDTHAVVFFDLSQSTHIEENQIVVFRDGDGELECIAEIKKSPSTITVIEGGRDWTLGQVFVIEAAVKNTVARVASIGQAGNIERVEIIEYGFPHIEGEIAIISPYPRKPLGSVFELAINVISTTPFARHYVASISDYVDGVVDQSHGSISSSHPNEQSYFSEYYNDPTPEELSHYVGWTVFTNSTIQPPPTETFEEELSIVDWLASRATLQIKFDVVIGNVGHWADDRGLLSNDQIRIQDNRRYQQFSYEIISESPLDDYRETQTKLHPAGTLMLNTYLLTTVIDIDVECYTSFPFVTLDKIEVVNVGHVDCWEFTKVISDIVTTPDHSWWEAIKPRTDELFATDAKQARFVKPRTEELFATDADQELFIKTRVDAVAVPDKIKFDYIKLKTDVVSVPDIIYTSNAKLQFDDVLISDLSRLTKDKTISDVLVTSDFDVAVYSKNINETSNILENATIHANKYITETFEAVDSSPQNLTQFSYASLDYSAEKYAVLELVLS